MTAALAATTLSVRKAKRHSHGPRDLVVCRAEAARAAVPRGEFRPPCALSRHEIKNSSRNDRQDTLRGDRHTPDSRQRVMIFFSCSSGFGKRRDRQQAAQRVRRAWSTPSPNPRRFDQVPLAPTRAQAGPPPLPLGPPRRRTVSPPPPPAASAAGARSSSHSPLRPSAPLPQGLLGRRPLHPRLHLPRGRPDLLRPGCHVLAGLLPLRLRDGVPPLLGAEQARRVRRRGAAGELCVCARARARRE